MTIRYLGLERRGGSLLIYRSITDKDGNGVIGVLQMPPEILSIRAGEYGLHPVDDLEAVLDMILFENTLEVDDIPIVDAPTLEEARDEQLRRCREKRDRFHARPRKTSREEDETHIEVLEALAKHLVADEQLALLARDQMKHAVANHRVAMARPVISVKAKMIDAIREREGV